MLTTGRSLDSYNTGVQSGGYMSPIRYGEALDVKTTNGGDSWTELTNGLPEGDKGKIGIAISRSNPDVLMAHVEHGFQPNCGGGRRGRLSAVHRLPAPRMRRPRPHRRPSRHSRRLADSEFRPIAHERRRENAASRALHR